ncbi:Uncharacterized protein M6B38_220520 [Iris pallida]|uniref:Uncharacterized protein n=1 Tax=Iris pallida TaxID=29817 RepID=A0AAX6DYS8_IRIPA|nr:Uncharacterized protein M6B38_220520 [Iris pallida]
MMCCNSYGPSFHLLVTYKRSLAFSFFITLNLFLYIKREVGIACNMHIYG